MSSRRETPELASERTKLALERATLVSERAKLALERARLERETQLVMQTCAQCEEALFQYISQTSSADFRSKVIRTRENWKDGFYKSVSDWNRLTPAQQTLEYLNVHMTCLVEEAERHLIEKDGFVTHDFVQYVDILKNLSRLVCNRVLDMRQRLFV